MDNAETIAIHEPGEGLLGAPTCDQAAMLRKG